MNIVNKQYRFLNNELCHSFIYHTKFMEEVLLLDATLQGVFASFKTFGVF